MADQPRIVATLTTLPYRYERLYTTLENFAKQDIHISKIYLII